MDMEHIKPSTMSTFFCYLVFTTTFMSLLTGTFWC